MSISKRLIRSTLTATVVLSLLSTAANNASARPRSWAADDVASSQQPSWMPFSMSDRSPNPAVARITAVEGNARSQGSGTLVDVRGQRGLVVTNWHVVRSATGPIVVKFPDGFQSAARVLKVDRDWDLAALLIWRPNAKPIAVSTSAPRPGDPLSIAGYGSGNYRAISGRCTQYVAPGRNMPYEMVELSAQARQGDSGGPILNEKGELAGVLFGSGHGSTSGTFCGRVRWFLASAWPADLHNNSDTLVKVPNHQPAKQWPDDRLVTVPHVAVPRYTTAMTPTPNYNIGANLTPATITADKAIGSKGSFKLNDLTGSSPLDQAKTILAAIGILALTVHIVRVAGTRS